MSDDPILDRLLADDPPELRDDPDYREHMKGTFAYHFAVLDEAGRHFGGTLAAEVRRLRDKVTQQRDTALRRWWNDPR